MSVSANFCFLQRIFTGGTAVRENLRNRGDHERILGRMKDADNIFFVMPLYVDSVPSHFAAFMKDAETFCRNNDIYANVYVISNGGFIEGNQNRVLMRVIENFCGRSGLSFCGGTGVGGGVMLNVIRIMVFVYLGLFALRLVTGVSAADAAVVLAKQLATVLFFYLGVLFCFIRMGLAASKGKKCGVMFTRALMPSFLFIAVADIFFIIISVFQGGIFRGWLRKHKAE